MLASQQKLDCTIAIFYRRIRFAPVTEHLLEFSIKIFEESSNSSKIQRSKRKSTISDSRDNNNNKKNNNMTDSNNSCFCAGDGSIKGEIGKNRDIISALEQIENEWDYGLVCLFEFKDELPMNAPNLFIVGNLRFNRKQSVEELKKTLVKAISNPTKLGGSSSFISSDNNHLEEEEEEEQHLNFDRNFVKLPLGDLDQESSKAFSSITTSQQPVLLPISNEINSKTTATGNDHSVHLAVTTVINSTTTLIDSDKSNKLVRMDGEKKKKNQKQKLRKIPMFLAGADLPDEVYLELSSFGQPTESDATTTTTTTTIANSITIDDQNNFKHNNDGDHKTSNMKADNNSQQQRLEDVLLVDADETERRSFGFLSLDSAYKRVFQSEPIHMISKTQQKKTKDYIFISTFLPITEIWEVDKNALYPNEESGSDHPPIYIEVDFQI